MDTLIGRLRENRKIRDAEHAREESKQIHEHNSRKREFEETKEITHRYGETIAKNLNLITDHQHAITKILHESKQHNGLPISNKYHKQSMDFINDAAAFLNNTNRLYTITNAAENADTSKLNSEVQSNAQATCEVLKEMQLSVAKVETLMQNMHVITNQYCEEERSLERSIFDD